MMGRGGRGRLKMMGRKKREVEDDGEGGGGRLKMKGWK